MKLTLEQQTIVDCVCSPTPNPLTLVDSVAGSGKTSLLVAIAKTLPHTNGLYLAYNKSIATESQRKFPKTTHCMTTHSMAYRATVKSFGLKLGTISHRTITERIKYETKWDIINSMRSFCLSRYLSFSDYAEENRLPLLHIKIANKYLANMQSGAIECTHDFYLKLFHIVLANKQVTYGNFDFIMLDEAGDLNEVTLEIFKLLPSQRKIAVGDKHQNIYQFNDTINCFNVLEGQGTLLHMTKSFRVESSIAKRIQTFCRSCLAPTMKFEGIPITDKTITTRAYLTRTNSALIAKMIQLNREQVPFSLLRRAADIFKIPLMLCNLTYQGFITDPNYKHLQNDVDDWHESDTIKLKHKSPLSYLASLHDDDYQLIQAVRLLQRHRKSLIIDTYEDARKHEKSRHNYTLATAHSCKGNEFDEVTISDDLNESIADIISDIKIGLPIDDIIPKDLESLNLYYVAITRTSKELFNAQYL